MGTEGALTTTFSCGSLLFGRVWCSTASSRAKHNDYNEFTRTETLNQKGMGKHNSELPTL